ncbi:hypothetical protein Ssi02_03280 [Sinosporangium siamense]|uniref:Uncharacterized protein n=1 Tax=Sinosporangium siamense TaxID=1367973 RepID=A0A919RAL1_9ACTN|nr:hypothetical protein Ssi02_03280 [Sinosporangium siamense]
MPGLVAGGADDEKATGGAGGPQREPELAGALHQTSRFENFTQEIHRRRVHAHYRASAPPVLSREMQPGMIWTQ